MAATKRVQNLKVGNLLREREGVEWTIAGKSQEYWVITAQGGRERLVKPIELEHKNVIWELWELGSWVPLQEPEQTFAARSWSGGAR